METKQQVTSKISVFPYSNKPYADKQKGEYAYKCVWDMLSFEDVLDKRIRDNVQENRMYSEAVQDNVKYHNMLRNKFGKDSRFVNVSDINFSGLGIVRILYRSLYQRLNKIQNDYVLEAIDPKSMAEKNEFLYDLKLRSKLSPVIKETTGIEIKKPMMPEEDEEIEFFASIGYKNDIEILLEEHLKKIDEVNMYDYEVVPQINSDLINGAVAATHLYFDDDGTIIEEAIDILNLKIVGGTKRDFSDAKGFVIDKEFNTEELFEYYLSDPSMYYIKGGKSYSSDDIIKMLQETESYKGITKVKIVYWQAFDTHTKKEIKYDGVVKLRNHASKNGDITTKVQRWYRSYYIPSLDMCFQYGAIPNVTRKKVLGKYTNAYCPVTAVRGVQGSLNYTSSPISVIRKFEDMATLAYIKLQNEIATANTSGYEYDLAQLASALEILKKDPQNATMMINDLIDIHKKTGTLFKSSKNTFHNSEYGQTARYVEGGVSKSARDYLEIMNTAIDLCYVFSGIPKIDTGAAQPTRTSNFVTKGMMEGADKAISDLMESKDYLQLVTGEKKMNMAIRLYMSSDKLPNPYKSAFSKIKGKIMESLGDLNTRELSMKLDKRMTEQEYITMKQDLIQLSNRYRETNGNEGISPVEMLYFEEWFKENPKYAKFMLEMKIKMRQNERNEQAQATQQATIQGQQESANQSAQNEAMLLQMKAENERLSKDLEWRNKKNEMILQTQLKQNPEMASTMEIDNPDVYAIEEAQAQQQAQMEQQMMQSPEGQQMMAEQGAPEQMMAEQMMAEQGQESASQPTPEQLQMLQQMMAGQG